MATKRVIRTKGAKNFGADALFGREIHLALEAMGVKPGEAFFLATTTGEARARRTDPDTSKQAAKSLGDLRPSQKAVLTVFEDWRVPMTDEQLVGAYRRAAEAERVPPQSVSGIRTRRRELTDAGLLVDTEERETTRSGRKAILWGLPPERVDSLFDSVAGSSTG